MTARIAIIGAGMAGASLAAELAGAAEVVLLEAEDLPGYHSTGRSAAFWAESYGGPFVQPLTTGSGDFLRRHGFLSPRGALHLAGEEGGEVLARMWRDFSANVRLERLEGAALGEIVPGLRPEWRSALLEPSCADIDVAGLHAFYLKAARRDGAKLVTGARVERAERRGQGWAIQTGAGVFEADILVNASGAWADDFARRAGRPALGIQPYRRTIVQLRVSPPVPAAMPLVIDASERFYFKPEAGGRLWLSPHDETPCDPCDCAPEEIDVATAIDRLQRVVDWQVERVERSWAGLRSFSPDRLPVYGYADERRDFFWFAGQGGFGIQTAPAAARLGAALLLGRPTGPVDPAPYAPARFQGMHMPAGF